MTHRKEKNFFHFTTTVTEWTMGWQVCVCESVCIALEGLWCNKEFTDWHCPLTVKWGKGAGLNSEERRSSCVGISLSPVSMWARSRKRLRGAPIGSKGSSKKECLECLNEPGPTLAAMASSARAGAVAKKSKQWRALLLNLFIKSSYKIFHRK